MVGATDGVFGERLHSSLVEPKASGSCIYIFPFLSVFLSSPLIHVNDHSVSLVIRHAVVEEFAELGAVVHIHAPGMKRSLMNAYVNGKIKVSKSVVQCVMYHLDQSERS